MPRYSKAYSEFILRLEEVEILTKVARRSLRKDPLGAAKEANALSRSAIVLLAGHIQGYVEDVSDAAITQISSKAVDRGKFPQRFRYYFSQDLLKQVKNAEDPQIVAQGLDDLLARDSDIWVGTGEFGTALNPDAFKNGFGSPAFKEIKKFLNRFGHSDLEKDIKDNLRSDFVPITTTFSTLVLLRNRIAHGDLSVRVTPAEVDQYKDVSKKLLRQIDSSFCAWFSTKGCNLRAYTSM